jgi:hypothetical protein
MKKKLIEENNDFMIKHNFLNNCRLMVINFVGLGWVCVGGGWGREVVLELGNLFFKN